MKQTLETISKENIKIGRLERKIVKLKKTVAHYMERCESYEHVINLNPMLVTRHQSYTEAVEERKRVKQLEERVQEQAKLIRILENLKKCEE